MPTASILSACIFPSAIHKASYSLMLGLLPPGLNGAEPAIGRVLVVPRYRRQGLARMLMLRAMDKIAQHFGSMPVRVSAQCYLLDFYQSLGFVVTGAPYDEDGIAHIDMLRPLP
jgi:ElaA protein